MKPYLAILIDSFWEAIGNRILWALLLGWSLILMGLAPFGYVSERSFKLSSVDIDNRSQLVSNLAKGANGEGNRSVQAIASRMDADFIAQLKQTIESDDGQGRRAINASQLAEKLNQVLGEASLYSPADFPTAARRPRLQPLIETAQSSTISQEELEELNRELLQLAFPLELNSPQGEQLWIGYAGFKLGDPLPVSRRQIKQFFEPILLSTIIKLGLGILAVFVAIVVTSPIIPDTFRSGSLHLLLSKPISRVWLYLAKFFGGCIFVLVNITFVLIGLYFIAGLRFEIWNAGLLACIPILMFVFIIFYSVSGLAGLIWGNAIVSVVACLIFWLVCFSLGFMHDALLPQVEVLPQISRIRSIDGRLMTVNERGELGVWNSQFSIWQPALELDVRGQARTFGPIYNAERKLIITKSFFRVPFGGLQARVPERYQSCDSTNRQLPVKKLTSDEPAEDISSSTPVPAEREFSKVEADAQPKSISEARQTPVWFADTGPELPAQLFDVVELGDTVVAVCRGGLFRLDLDKLDVSQAGQKGLFGIQLPWMTQNAFENIAPKDYFLSANSHAAPTQAGDGLIVFSSGNLDHLVYENDTLRVAHSAKLDGDGTEATLVEMNAEYCVVARDGHPLKILDAQLKPLTELSLPDNQKVRQMAWIPGRSELSILTHTGNGYVLACQAATLTELVPQLRGQITCLDWDGSQQLWLGVKPNSVYRFDVARNTVKQQFIPQATILERIFRWGLKPAYIINPKPAALDTAMSYVLTGNETQALGLITNDLAAAQIEIDLWTPLVSNFVFVAAVLGFSSWYVSRKEY